MVVSAAHSQLVDCQDSLPGSAAVSPGGAELDSLELVADLQSMQSMHSTPNND